jgi:hypothetical protein
LFNITVELKATLSFELHTSPLLVTHVEIGNLRQYEGLNQSSTVNKATSCRTQSLIPQGKASFIPVQHLQFIPLFIAEHKQRIPERIQFHLLFHHDNQAIDGFTEVDIA